MSPNFVQYTIAAVDLASAQITQRTTTSPRTSLRSFADLQRTALNVTISHHLNRARKDLANGDRVAFERRCERASHLARHQAPDRIDDVESLLSTASTSAK